MITTPILLSTYILFSIRSKHKSKSEQELNIINDILY